MESDELTLVEDMWGEDFEDFLVVKTGKYLG
jgi:hypothetical protein